MPTSIFELYRGSYGSELLTAAVCHFQVFAKLESGPKSWDELRQELGLARRPMHVLVTALRAMQLIERTESGGIESLRLTTLARQYLAPGSYEDVSGYIGLSASAPGVLEMVERLRTNRPAGAAEPDAGAAFIFRDGLESAMEREATARHFTLALAGRAKIVAPVLARTLPLPSARRLLDVGGGTGLYAYSWLQQHPQLTAVIWDRPEVLKVAAEMARERGVAERVELVAGDMFQDSPPANCDVCLLSNVLHDWDEPECERLVARCAAALPDDGRLLIHDVFLDDDLGGPLPIALYSAALFSFTEGRAYSAAEYRTWLARAGLAAGEILPTAVHCGVLPAMRSGR